MENILITIEDDINEEIQNSLLDSIEKFPHIQSIIDTWKDEIFISEIIDQNGNNRGEKFPDEKRFYVFLKAYSKKNCYIELECSMSYMNFVTDCHIETCDVSSHGYPVSYGETIYKCVKDEKSSTGLKGELTFSYVDRFDYMKNK